MRKKISQTFSVLTASQEASIKNLSLQNNELLTEITIAVSPPMKIARVIGAILPAIFFILITEESEIKKRSGLSLGISLYAGSLLGILLAEIVTVYFLPRNNTGTLLPPIHNDNSQDADRFIKHLTHENNLLKECSNVTRRQANFLRIAIPLFNIYQQFFPTFDLLYSMKQNQAAGIILGPILVSLTVFHIARKNSSFSKIGSKLNFFYRNPDRATAILERQTLSSGR